MPRGEPGAGQVPNQIPWSPRAEPAALLSAHAVPPGTPPAPPATGWPKEGSACLGACLDFPTLPVGLMADIISPRTQRASGRPCTKLALPETTRPSSGFVLICGNRVCAAGSPRFPPSPAPECAHCVRAFGGGEGDTFHGLG